MQSRKRTLKKGYTLLEVLLTTLVISVGLVSLIWVFTSGISAVSDIEGSELALDIVQANMELVKSKAFTAVDTSAELSALISNLGFSNYTVTSGLSVNYASQLIMITITVSWNVKGGSNSIALKTMKANY